MSTASLNVTPEGSATGEFSFRDDIGSSVKTRYLTSKITYAKTRYRVISLYFFNGQRRDEMDPSYFLNKTIEFVVQRTSSQYDFKDYDYRFDLELELIGDDILCDSSDGIILCHTSGEIMCG